MASGLNSQGLPTTLLPETVAEGEELLNDISELPVDKKEAVSGLTAVLATVRMYFSAAAARATAASTTPLLRALAAALEGLIEAGGRLISIPIGASAFHRIERPNPGELSGEGSAFARRRCVCISTATCLGNETLPRLVERFGAERVLR